MLSWGAWLRTALGFAILAQGQAAVAISGFIRDTQGSAIEGATITVTAIDSTQLMATARSDSLGAYNLSGLPSGSYALAVEKAGFSAPAKRQILAETGQGAIANFELSRPALKLAAAGVRGLIDPGGYSAPAQAAAAPGMIAGVASIQRADNSTTAVSPCTPDGDLRLGESYLASGRFADARAIFAPLAKERADARIYRLAAQASEGSGMFAEAAQAYQSAADLDHSEDSLFGIGYELILLGDPDRAATAFRAGLKLLPASAKLWIGAGAAEFLSGNAPQAVQSFLHAVDLGPSDPRPYGYLEKAFSASGAEADLVEARFKRFIELAPGNAAAPYYYAACLRKRQAQDSTAEVMLKRAIDLDPGMAQAHLLLASFYAEQGNNSSAVHEYEKAVQLAPDLADAHYRLAALYRTSGREDLAATQLKAFQETRDRQKNKEAGSGLALEQFISVFNPSGGQHPATAPCPALPR